MNQEELIRQLQKKRLVFTVTTGRSGTAYLSAILGYARDTYAVHEPEPEFAEVLRPVQKNHDLAINFLLEKKLPAILRNPAAIYIETSHLTCKGFLEPLLQLGLVPDLVIHRRPARDVARSMLTMGTIPGRSEKGLRFYLSPDDPNVLQLANWQTMHDYQLCYWYCLEIERRCQVYKDIFTQRGAKIAETTLVSLRTFSGLVDCFTALNLQLRFPAWLTRLRFQRAARVRVNESLETKKNIVLPENLLELEQEVLARINAG
ncbi:hypothetical protein [Candidatus Electronema sp. PJ]|uniref:hypothetical protein n=1 Tax=Candidatus Electronema sp. PJ TaxID=3401572 RepID=UPI003AA7E051